ncbi:MAG: 2-dehydropantoate 2-reductase [Thermoflexus sp.]|uniref:2-dehydropantoate 2-reductase n=1 Tax=Thermoflexus sp. TaxID=1969742 RepID=UPI0025F7E64E|nr:2-dehydropantoate 2-reductase [Thermoflexus sp.]MCS6963743.1 2-dehydropantoate 2-reductase [Thermoflexus sp.]MDW8184579.1 2-dehydropantoate 2-reductase [Anaerolineae bacterium]
MRVTVFGSGGVGGYFGALLARAGHEVTFIARGPHLEAMRARGLQVHSVHGDFHLYPVRATDRPEEAPPADLVLYAVKTYHIPETVGMLPRLLGPEGVVLTTQNGVEAPDQVAAEVGVERTLAGAVWVVSRIEAPGVIRQESAFRRVVLGELDGQLTPRAQAIARAFAEAGAEAEATAEIRKVLWTKFLFIAAIGGVGSVVRLPIGAWRAVPETRALLEQAMREIEAAARAEGVALDPEAVPQTMAFIDNLAPTATASMQRDVEAGRPLELEAMSGAVVRIGRRHGLPTPAHAFLYAVLKPVHLQALRNAGAG